jgi:hypothetical protein
MQSESCAKAPEAKKRPRGRRRRMLRMVGWMLDEKLMILQRLRGDFGWPPFQTQVISFWQGWKINEDCNAHSPLVSTLGSQIVSSSSSSFYSSTGL